MHKNTESLYKNTQNHIILIRISIQIHRIPTQCIKTQNPHRKIHTTRNTQHDVVGAMGLGTIARAQWVSTHCACWRNGSTQKKSARKWPYCNRRLPHYYNFQLGVSGPARPAVDTCHARVSRSVAGAERSVARGPNYGNRRFSTR